MSQLCDQLHEDARRRFEELGRSLLARVATFRGLPAPARPSLVASAVLVTGSVVSTNHSARVRPFKSTASVEFLRTQLFEWAMECHRGQGSGRCVDYVLRALESAVSEHRLLFPVSDLHVQSPLTLGSVTVSTFPESIFEELESKKSDDRLPRRWLGGVRRWARTSRALRSLMGISLRRAFSESRFERKKSPVTASSWPLVGFASLRQDDME